MITFTKDSTLIRNHVPYRIARVVENNIQLESTITGEFLSCTIEQLLDEYMQNKLHIDQKRRHFPSADQATDYAELKTDHLSNAARLETRRRIEYIHELEKQCAFFKSKAELCEAALEISQKRNDTRPPHITTIYRWRKQLERARKDIRALFSRLSARGGRNQSRLDPEVEVIIQEKIESVFLSNKRGGAEDVYDDVFLAIQQTNTARIEREWLKVPGLRTIERRIAALPAFDVAAARYGVKEAERRFAKCGQARRVTRILELVEIDHTPVDILIVNEKREVIGRPTLTVVLDRYSRCILGYHLSLAGHGTPAVFEAIRHALLPKTYIKTRYPDLNLSWNCFGWFECILMDNGREFHAEAVTDALLNLAIITEYAASRDPNDKAHVERFLKTFNYSFIHKLPGTTLAKVHQRIGFRAEDEACLTLEELDRMIHAWILGVYHLRRHAGLGGRAPIDVWNESAKAFPPQLKASVDDIDIEFGEVNESTPQQYGIDLNNFRYASDRLTVLFGTLPKKTKVHVKWPRHDVGCIWIWDPLEKEYFKATNTDASYDGLTVEQAKAVKKQYEDNPEYKRTRAEAKEMIRATEADAMGDKQLKNRRKGARLANKTSKEFHRDEPQFNEMPSKANPPPAQEETKVEEFEIDGFDVGGGH